MKILIIRLSSLGDVALAALLVRRLRESFPKSQLDFATGAAYRQLLEAIPELDGRFVPGKDKFDDYDVVIDLQNNLRSRWLTKKVHAGQICRYHRPRLNRFLRIHFPSVRNRLKTPDPVARQYVKTAASLGVLDDGSRGALVPPVEWIQAAARLMKENGLIGKPLLVAPGSRHQTKIWPAEKWFDFIKLANDKGFHQIGIIGTKDDLELALRFRESLHRLFPISIFCGSTDLAGLVGLIASAKLLVCGDSGPMHIAAAVGTPVAAIFGPTVQEFGFAPFSDRSRVVEVSGLSCRPCHAHGPAKCPREHFRCMLEISPDNVLKKALELTDLNNGIE